MCQDLTGLRMNSLSDRPGRLGVAHSPGICLAAAFAISMAYAGGSSAQDRAQDAWQDVSGCTDTVDVEMFIQAFPESRFAEEARTCLATLRGSETDVLTGDGEMPRSHAPAPEELEAMLELTLEQRVLIQHGLNSLDHTIGIVDGVFGNRTRQAISKYQQVKGLPSTGFLTSEQSDGLMALGEARERHAWLDARNAKTQVALRDYLSTFPLGAYSDEAYAKLAELESGERSFDNTQNELERQVVRLNTLLSDTRSKLEERKNTIAELEASLTEARSELERGHAEATSLNAGLKEARLEISEVHSRMAALEALLEGTSKELADSQQSETDLELALNQARDELDASRSSASELGARLDANRQEPSTTQAALERVRQLLSGSRDELTAARTEATQAQNQLTVAQGELDRSQDELKEAREDLSLVFSKYSVSQVDLEKTRDELATTRAEAARAQVQLMIAQDILDQSKDELEEPWGELFQIRAQYSVSRAALEKTQEELAQIRAQYSVSRTDLERTREDLAAARAETSDVQARLTVAQVEIASLGKDLNQALARVAAEQKKRADLEERERRRLEAEAQDLRRFRSEFLAQLQDVLGGREGVRIVGDRFAFSSEILFEVGSDVLGDTGKDEIRRVAEIIRDVAGKIPPEVDWVLRVDGHTDKTPVRANEFFDDNWDLSQARALSVVRYMIDELGIPANRLAATGFGEHRPISESDDPQSLARNRRIELKFTEQ